MMASKNNNTKEFDIWATSKGSPHVQDAALQEFDLSKLPDGASHRG